MISDKGKAATTPDWGLQDAADDDLLFVASLEGSHVAAVSKSRHGVRVWQVQVTTNNLRHNRNALIAHPPTRSLLVFSGTFATALVAATGASRWSVQLKGNDTTPMVAMDSGALYDAATMSSNWFPGAAELMARAALRNTVFLGTLNRVRAYNIELGSLAWNFGDKKLGDQPTLLIEDEVVYAGGKEGMLFALDALQGTLLWSVCVGFDFPLQLGLATMRSHPLYTPPNYDPTSASPINDPSLRLYVGDHRTVQVLDQTTGAPYPGTQTHNFRSTGFFSTPTSTHVIAIPLPSQGRVLLCRNNLLVAWNPTTGDAAWTGYLPSVVAGPGVPRVRPAAGQPHDGLPAYSLQAPTAASPAPAAGSRVFVHVGNGLWCVNAGDGSVAWNKPIGVLDSLSRPHLLADGASGRLFAAGAKRVVCHDARDGSLLWKSPVSVKGDAIFLATSQRGTGEVNRSPAADMAFMENPNIST